MKKKGAVGHGLAGPALPTRSRQRRLANLALMSLMNFMVNALSHRFREASVPQDSESRHAGEVLDVARDESRVIE